MNSLEEKALFEAHGWEKDYISGDWVSPGSPTITITTKMLMEYTTTKDGEETLKDVIKGYGRRV